MTDQDNARAARIVELMRSAKPARTGRRAPAPAPAGIVVTGNANVVAGRDAVRVSRQVHHHAPAASKPRKPRKPG